MILYPKVPGILQKLTQYTPLVQPLLGKKIRKSAKVFNDKKVTDHHAIIPTGIERGLPSMEQNVYDAIARQFIAAFYPDCLVANTTVIGEVEGIKFKTTGKEILDPGWRLVFPKKPKEVNEEDDKKAKEEKILPAFTVGESGPHEPTLVEKQTKPPKYYTEATLLRAMETAGKRVDDDELRDLMKANGIGRPSTRANIIETLFKRKYIQRKKKQIHPTEMGVQLIDIIQNKLLKSAELTGQWEKQLRDIEAGAYSASAFVKNMKQMVSGLVEEVRMSQTQMRLSSTNPTKPLEKKRRRSRNRTKAKSVSELTCPKCQKGKLLSGKSAYGCSQWKEGCTFRIPYAFLEKKLPENQVVRLVEKGSSTQLKGFIEKGHKQVGKLILTEEFELVFEAKKEKNSQTKNTKTPDKLACPTCNKGTILKGKNAYGCSRWKEGCNFRMSFDQVRQAAQGQKINKELVIEILRKGT